MSGNNNGYQRQVDDVDQEVEEFKVIPVENKTIQRKCCGDSFRVIVLGIIVFSFAVTIGLIADIYSRTSHDTNEEAVVITDATQCTKIATNIIKINGGSAMDAVIAAVICLAVVKPDQFSLAGGGMMLLGKNDENIAINMLYTVPTLATNKHLNSTRVAVPNLLRGLMCAHDKYGRIPWSDLVSPSISLGDEGFYISNSTGKNIKKYFPVLPKIIQELFTVNGSVIKSGDNLKRPRLATLLQSLTNDNLKLEDDIIKTVNAHGGLMTGNDFSAYKPTLLKPIVSSYKDYKVVSPSPPSGGVLVQSALNILDRLTAKKNMSISYQHVVEVLKIIFSKVELLETPANKTAYQDILQQLLSYEFAKNQSEHIENKICVELPSMNFQEPSSKISSVRVIVVSENGEMVSFIGSLGNIFGSKLMTDYGVILNNGLALYNSQQKRSLIKSGTQPFTFVAPMMLFEKGSSTDSYIFSPSADMEGMAAVTQVITNMLDVHMKPSKALQFPRLYPDVFASTLRLQRHKFLEFNLQSSYQFLKSTYGNISNSERDIGSVMLACNKPGSRRVLTDESW